MLGNIYCLTVEAASPSNIKNLSNVYGSSTRAGNLSLDHREQRAGNLSLDHREQRACQHREDAMKLGKRGAQCTLLVHEHT
ncbi:MAG TPA: hypothetical protein IAA29_14645 [Candidatus Paenibacillus intestinavium]|nr:hypothetical protein [Candidatus Paenibacillus intestinavium]